MISLNNTKELGDLMHGWAKDLFPICRSLTGLGVRETLKYIKGVINGLVIHEIPTGTKAFDWEVPQEWTIRKAYIENSLGDRIIDFDDNNLHVVGYSEPIDKCLEYEQLNNHLYSLEAQPNAIPYVTSYYKRHWGFCLTHNQRVTLNPGQYHVVIDSELKSGFLSYAELFLKGNSEQEVFLSTYICHPSMANNELSGPVVTTAIAKWISSLPFLRYSYRIIYIPETIGSIVYLSKNINHLKNNVIAGFNVTCIGDDRCYSYLPSRAGNTLADQVAKHVLSHIASDFKSYTWLDRGSDERQYCAPGVDLPIATIMRSKYGRYPEYHTSLDDLTLVTPSGLLGGFTALMKAIQTIESIKYPKVCVLGEPQLGKRGLYPNLSIKGSVTDYVLNMMNLISYSDGKKSTLDIAELIGVPMLELIDILEPLIKNRLIEVKDFAW